MIEYRLKGELELLKSAIERSKRLPGRRWHQRYIPRALTILGYGFGIYCAAVGIGLIADFPETGLLLFLPLSLMVLIEFISKLASPWFMRLAYARWPSAGKLRLIVLDESGLRISEEGTTRQLAWGEMEALSRFPDGLFLRTKNGRFDWWPDRALSSGTVPDVVKLLKKHASRYEEIS